MMETKASSGAETIIENQNNSFEIMQPSDDD